jgi:6,7-dimethyl-8-ribityllumazine synthase
MQNAITKKFEVFDASDYNVAIVRACFNDEITSKMQDNAISTLHQYKVSNDNISLFEVPGCVEIPVILKALAETEDFDAIVALGCVIRGDTPHFDYVCKMVSEGVLKVSLDHTLPIGFGIATVNNLEQAIAREDIGADATVAALQSAKIILDL